jgi:hypothetical protein
MDGDNGRKLSSPRRGFTELAKKINRRFSTHPIKLRILQRHGIENYFPRRTYEHILRRDMAPYFPIPETVKIEEHLRDQNGPFYSKTANEQIAEHITYNDIAGTDLADIIDEVHRDAEAARQY